MGAEMILEVKRDVSFRLIALRDRRLQSVQGWIAGGFASIVCTCDKGFGG